MIKVLLFASLAEQAGTDTVVIEQPVSNVEQLLGVLRQHAPKVFDVIEARRSLLIAVNQQLVRRDASVKDGDEVAFMPPVTGG
ncbi:molybdopterin converting factor subunit 1 [Permianibacter aggregans]|uniref:Molybdopterin synthase sulfur carrier subunit n=1 Tax=Permianibacter aggregans TaxID=1510150 RepID=A0A4R6USP5_9GAMM|nr:molybdopterin converting factor subunit 1 [Permianibacter aggregans]TDQ48683.1 molybdopterin synthase subunit MoaD [Permianibacter aggregans]